MHGRTDHRACWAERAARALAASAAACGLFSAACSVLIQHDSDQCQTSADCQGLAAGAICTTDGVCQAVAEPSATRLAGRACLRSSDCPGTAICHGGTCRELDAAGCVASGQDKADGENLVFGILVPSAELDGTAAPAVWGGALTAVNEINRAAASFHAPHLLLVACSDAEPRAVRTLREAGAVVFLGPSEAEALRRTRESLNGEGIVFAPAADAPALLDEGQNTSVVTCKPNASDLRAEDAAAIAFMRAGLEKAGKVRADRATVVALTDGEQELGYGSDERSAREAGLQQVVYHYQQDGADLARQLLATNASLIVAGSDEVDWSYNLTAVERAMERHRQPRPFYLLNAKHLNALDVIQADLTGMLNLRVVGRTSKSTERSQQVRAAFALSFRDVVGRSASPESSYVHECTYLAFYAAVAAQHRYSLSVQALTPASILVGLRALDGAEPVIDVGSDGVAEALAQLESARGADDAFRLLGSSGPIELSNLPSVEQVALSTLGRYVHPRPSDGEFYCVQAANRTFCDTGLVIPTSGGPITGSTSCDCFPF